MRGIEMIRLSSRARVALFAAAALLAGSGAVIAQARTEQARPYRSSIQVPDTDKERDDEDSDGGDEAKEKGERAEASEASESGKAEGNDEESGSEQAEAARFRSLARVTVEQARAAAIARVPGTVESAELENEDGNLVYGVIVKTNSGVQDVKVDAGNGKVLHVEAPDSDR